MIVKKYKHVEKEGSSSLVSTRDTGEESGNAEKNNAAGEIGKAGKGTCSAEEKRDRTAVGTALLIRAVTSG